MKKIKKDILNALSNVKDPELGVNIVDLGLVYNIEVNLNKNEAIVSMTMTTPTCPLLGLIMKDVEEELSKVKSIEKIHIDLVWDPPWTPDRMSEKAKKQLGYM